MFCDTQKSIAVAEVVAQLGSGRSMISMVYNTLGSVINFPTFLSTTYAVINVFKKHEEIFVKVSDLFQTLSPYCYGPSGKELDFLYKFVLSTVLFSESRVFKIEVLYLVYSNAIYSGAVCEKNFALYNPTFRIFLHSFDKA